MIFARASFKDTSLQVPKGSSVVFLQKAVDRNRALSFSQDERASEAPEGLKDSECKKGNLLHRPPIPYVPPTDLLPATNKIETIKIKVSDGTTVNMKIFSVGSPEEYLSRIVAVLGLIDRKGLREQSTAFYGEIKNANTAILALKRKALASKDKCPPKDQEADEEQFNEAPEADAIEKSSP